MHLYFRACVKTKKNTVQLCSKEGNTANNGLNDQRLLASDHSWKIDKYLRSVTLVLLQNIEYRTTLNKHLYIHPSLSWMFRGGSNATLWRAHCAFINTNQMVQRTVGRVNRQTRGLPAAQIGKLLEMDNRTGFSNAPPMDYSSILSYWNGLKY